MKLGVRRALKPYTTITMAEDKLVFSFDVGQIAIRTYRHLGEGIDFGEVERMRGELEKAIKIVGSQAAGYSALWRHTRARSPTPEAATDTETLGLYGAVHKRLWEMTNAVPHLDKAIWE